MNKSKALISLALGALCLWFCFSKVDFVKFRACLSEIYKPSLLPVLFCVFATHLLRTKRWRYLLGHITQAPFVEIFTINAVGFLSIHVLPLRLGEFTRPLLLKEKRKVPIMTGLATIAVERVFDGLAAALILVVGVLGGKHLGISTQATPIMGLGLDAMWIGALAIFVPALALLLFAVWRRKDAMKFIEKLSLYMPLKYQNKLSSFAEHFFTGLEALPNIKRLLIIFTDSLLVWGLLILAYGFLHQAFALQLHWSSMFLVVGLSAIGIMIPGPPGFVGTYQFAVMLALMAFGVEKDVALAYAMVFYVLNLSYVGLSGVLSMQYLSTNFRRMLGSST